MVSPVRVRVPPLLKYLQISDKNRGFDARPGPFDSIDDSNRLGEGVLHGAYGLFLHVGRDMGVGVQGDGGEGDEAFTGRAAIGYDHEYDAQKF